MVLKYIHKNKQTASVLLLDASRQNQSLLVQFGKNINVGPIVKQQGAISGNILKKGQDKAEGKSGSQYIQHCGNNRVPGTHHTVW